MCDETFRKIKNTRQKVCSQIRCSFYLVSNNIQNVCLRDSFAVLNEIFKTFKINDS